MPLLAPVRWILNGKHDGWGTLENQLVQVFLFLVLLILNLGHMDYREYCLFDYVSIWKQILIHTGAVY